MSKIPALERKYQPLGNRILIRPIENTKEDRLREGGIEIPEDAVPTHRAEVLAAGKGEVAMQTGNLIPMELKEGDIILVRKGVGFLPIRMNGEDLMLMREGDVEAVVS